MTDQKNKIIEKGIKSIPKFVWIVCGSYALTVITTVLALNFAHIDADKHINRYMEILLKRQESKVEFKQCDHFDIEDRLSELELHSHKPRQAKQ